MILPLKENDDNNNNPPVKSGFHKMNRKKASFERFSASSRLQTTIEQSSLSIYCTEVIV